MREPIWRIAVIFFKAFLIGWAGTLAAAVGLGVNVGIAIGLVEQYNPIGAAMFLGLLLGFLHVIVGFFAGIVIALLRLLFYRNDALFLVFCPLIVLMLGIAAYSLSLDPEDLRPARWDTFVASVLPLVGGVYATIWFVPTNDVASSSDADMKYVETAVPD